MSNCLIFALAKCFRYGGYFIARKSHHGWWPHALWSPDLRTFHEYVPPPGTRMDVVVPPPLFRGQVRVSEGGEQMKEYTVSGSITLELPRTFTVMANSVESAEWQAIELCRQLGEVDQQSIEVYEPVEDGDA